MHFSEEWLEEYKAKRRKTFKKKRKQGKYNNKKTIIDGFEFDSKLEARYYEQLKLLQKAGEIEKIELQPKFELLPAFTNPTSGKRHRAINYIADFKVFYKDGSIEIVDVKGVKTQVFNIKYKLFEYKYPNLKLKIVTKKDI